MMLDHKQNMLLGVQKLMQGEYSNELACRHHHNVVPLSEGDEKFKVLDQRRMLDRQNRQLIVDQALQTTEQDNEAFLLKFEDRVKQ